MSLFHLFRVSYLQKFLAVLRRDGPGEALGRAAYYIRLIAFGEGRSAVSNGSGSPGHAFAPYWESIASENAFKLTTAPALQMQRRRIAVIGDLNLPQCRKYRVQQLEELWATGGIDVTYSHFEDFPRCADILQSASHVLFYRLSQSPLVSAYLYEARRLGLPSLYDIDDPLFSVPAYATYSNAATFSAGLRSHFISQAPLYAAVMNACDAISVSTPALREHAGLFSSRPIFVRRNFADKASLDGGSLAAAAVAQHGATRRDGTPFTLAFASGSNGHEADLNTIMPDVQAFLSAAPDRRLLILGRFDQSQLPESILAKAEIRPFLDYVAYLKALAAADCVVMPLTDDLFNRCKSGVRLIDAASVGVAAVVPEVGDSSTMVRHGQTGFVVGPGDSWIEVLERMAADRNSTATMGEAARHHLETEWSARLQQPVIEPEMVEWIKA